MANTILSVRALRVNFSLRGNTLPAERGAHERWHAARFIRGEDARRLYAHSDLAVMIEYIHICLQ